MVCNESNSTTKHKINSQERNMFSIDEIKKKREIYERKIEDIIVQFEEDLPSEVKIENVVAIRLVGVKGLKCSIKLAVEDLNK